VSEQVNMKNPPPEHDGTTFNPTDPDSLTTYPQNFLRSMIDYFRNSQASRLLVSYV